MKVPIVKSHRRLMLTMKEFPSIVRNIFSIPGSEGPGKENTPVEFHANLNTPDHFFSAEWEKSQGYVFGGGWSQVYYLHCAFFWVFFHQAGVSSCLRNLHENESNSSCRFVNTYLGSCSTLLHVLRSY